MSENQKPPDIPEGTGARCEQHLLRAQEHAEHILAVRCEYRYIYKKTSEPTSTLVASDMGTADMQFEGFTSGEMFF